MIIETIIANRYVMFFIDGPGGTKKSFLYRALLATIRTKGMIALTTATSGVAASILPSGRTAHSRFEIPLEANETSMCNISKQSAREKLIQKEKLIIWDETPMAKKYTIKLVDRMPRDIMDCPHPFEGKVIVFGGYFRQVLRMFPKGTRQQTMIVSLRKSYLQEKMHKIQLNKNMRAYDDT
ncbi:hypothetical protein IC582_007813 [Cucumis melo]